MPDQIDTTYSTDDRAEYANSSWAAGMAPAAWITAKDQFEWLRAVREPEKINGLDRKQRLIAGMLATAYDRRSKSITLSNRTVASYCGYKDYESVKVEVEGLVRDGWLERKPGGMRKGKLQNHASTVYRLRIPTAVLEKIRAFREASEIADDETGGHGQQSTTSHFRASAETAKALGPARTGREKPVCVPVTEQDGLQTAAVLCHLLRRRGRKDLADLLEQEEERWLLLAKTIRPRLVEGTGWTLDRLFRAALDETAFGELPAAMAIRKSVSQLVAARTLKIPDVAAWHMLRYTRLVDREPMRAVGEKKAAARAAEQASARRRRLLPDVRPDLAVRRATTETADDRPLWPMGARGPKGAGITGNARVVALLPHTS